MSDSSSSRLCSPPSDSPLPRGTGPEASPAPANPLCATDVPSPSAPASAAKPAGPTLTPSATSHVRQAGKHSAVPAGHVSDKTETCPFRCRPAKRTASPRSHCHGTTRAGGQQKRPARLPPAQTWGTGHGARGTGERPGEEPGSRRVCKLGSERFSKQRMIRGAAFIPVSDRTENRGGAY